MYGAWSKNIIDMRYVNLINLAGQLKAGRGLAIVVALIKGSVSDSADRQKAEEVSWLQFKHFIQISSPFAIIFFVFAKIVLLGSRVHVAQMSHRYHLTGGLAILKQKRFTL